MELLTNHDLLALEGFTGFTSEAKRRNYTGLNLQIHEFQPRSDDPLTIFDFSGSYPTGVSLNMPALVFSKGNQPNWNSIIEQSWAYLFEIQHPSQPLGQEKVILERLYDEIVIQIMQPAFPQPISSMQARSALYHFTSKRLAGLPTAYDSNLPLGSFLNHSMLSYQAIAENTWGTV